ncbi:MAG: sigma-70 family RNA polymerase sigma factor [Gemmataceae bacterium]|nr:sigma-70 family RNA polymerase sigma factor [Gemmataceae bacterium]MCI0742329.1 sigma-70 family RNA polymerase sigma factor [Gemmataceae bacterium]
MATRSDTMVRFLRGLAVREKATEASDGELLQRFAQSRDEAAFAALVRRHGPLVQGVCRRVLCDTSAADDAFQATFLVLSKNAASLGADGSLASWLYGVARRTAWKARTAAARRRQHEGKSKKAPVADPFEEVSLREAMTVLDEELARLPEKLRTPLLLCCLEGQARDEAAQQLGWSAALVKSRLEQAREILRKRLTRRGLSLSAGLFAMLLSQCAAKGCVPAALVATTVKAATSGLWTPELAVLAGGVMKTMFWNKLRVNATLLTLALLTTLAAAFYWQQVQALEAQGRPVAPLQAKEPAQEQQVEQPSKQGRIYFHLSVGAGPALHSVEPDGKKETALARAHQRDDYYYQIHSACLSPDSKRLAFGLARFADNGIYPPDKLRIRDVTKSEESSVVADMAGAELHSFVWSPDGKKIAFSSWDAETKRRNWIVDVETKKTQPLKLPMVKDEKDGAYEMTVCDWSRDGKHFLAVGNGVYLVNVEGKLVRRLSPEPSIFFGAARLSPDGKKALFVSSNKDHSNTLYVADTATGKSKAIVEAANFSGMRAVWGPDSKRIAYIVTLLDENGNRGEETNLFVVDADGQNSVALRSEKHEPKTIRLVLTDWR